MIYCVIPEALSAELYGKLTDYYKDDPNVEVIVERREGERREYGEDADQAGSEQRVVRDRRRRRPGSFPKIDAG